MAGAKKGSQRGPAPKELGEVLGVGLQFAGAILLFLFLGRWLDAWLGTEPWLLLLGVAIGATSGFYSMYHHLVIAPRNRKDEEQGR